MPFKSRVQMKAAFSGALGSVMKSKARQWVEETPNIKRLPEHVKKSKKKGRGRGKSKVGKRW